MANSPCEQAGFDVRFEWGLEGVTTLARASDLVIVVDVFSFSSAVDVATSRGAIIIPAERNDDRARDLAASSGAVLAVERRHLSPRTPYSLSPASFSSIEAGVRVVLPSPNGATIALRAKTLGTSVVAGCLRNAGSVAAAAETFGRRVTVIAAGERWPNGALRPALEDLVGAGAIIARLRGSLSPEAAAAVGAFRTFDTFDLAEQLAGCSSARELIDAGHPEDVHLAAMLNVSETVPVLRGGAFGAGDAQPDGCA
jgi:2-phosphosulfolactate phosphatase